MGIHIRVNHFRIFLLMALMFSSPVALGLGLGDAEVRSYLNEPLSAHIRLISRSTDELATVTAGLASARDIQAMGLSRIVSVPLNFRVHADANNPFIEVRSRLPVTDPILQLVVEVTWTGGRMLREYTLFLDPPTFASKAPAPMVITPPAAPQTRAPEPVVTQPSPSPQAITRDYPDPQAANTVESGQQSQADAQAVPEIAVAETSEAPVSEPVPKAMTPEPSEILGVPAAPAANSDESLLERKTVTVPDAPMQPKAETVQEKVAEVAGIEALPAEDLISGEAQDNEADSMVAVEAEPVSEPAIEEAAPVVADDAVVELDDITDEPFVPELPIEDPLQAEEQFTDTATSEQPGEEPEVPVAEASSPAASEPAPEILPDTQAGKEIADILEADMTSTAEESGEVLGPVESGQTLWGIASNYASGSEYSINQAMLAIQRLNPEAFGGNNINSLKRGAILRMPTFREMGRVSERQAMVEAIRQEQAYQAMRSGRPYEDVPAIADTGQEVSPAVTGDSPDPELVTVARNDDARLQLVPPSLSEETGTGGGAGEQPTGSVSSQEVEEVLARTEEELANAQQENAYLNERIRELEAQIAASGGTVASDELAEMEESLREDRLAGNDVQTPQAADDDVQPWYQAYSWWLAGLLVLLIAAGVWILRRIGGGGAVGKDGGPDDGGQDTVKSIRNEAEEILESLEDGGNSVNEDNVIDLESYVEPEVHLDTEPDEEEVEPDHDAEPKTDPAVAFGPDPEEAVELDSDDPEVKLDLARAYISMGDKEAAREMLEEVLESGNDEQVQEARGMMEEI